MEGQHEGISVGLCVPSKALAGVRKPALNTHLPSSLSGKGHDSLLGSDTGISIGGPASFPHQKGVWNSLVFKTELREMSHPQTPHSGQPSCWESFVVSRDVTLQRPRTWKIITQATSGQQSVHNPSHHTCLQAGYCSASYAVAQILGGVFALKSTELGCRLLFSLCHAGLLRHLLQGFLRTQSWIPYCLPAHLGAKPPGTFPI